VTSSTDTPTDPRDRSQRPTLAERLPRGGTNDPDQILDLVLDWASETGFDLYPHQEEALLETVAGRHVVLSTPTGSGKSLVALGLHFKALCEGRTSFYTSPIKALASEKFFDLCELLGPENVGMLTGDASINPDAGVICCTAEVLANLVLRRGEDLDAPYVVMDEFHYYADRDRGWAWQVPLIALPRTRFLLMSATLGDMSTISRHLEQATGIEVSSVTSVDRPVPLDFRYCEAALHETVQELVESGKAPIYIVNFTQRDCAELAQNLTSMPLTGKEQKAAIREALVDVRFSTPYGREFRRFLGFGIGVHHAGLLPRYRLTVEQLAQNGLLKIISGTDTLGVGVNIPIRTVLFTKLAKYDGRKVAHLKVRDFQQIAGRAGRKGFDEEGSVVAQAPDDVIERLKAERKAAATGHKKKPKKATRRSREGEVSWTGDTFTKLINGQPERLRSRFRLTGGMVVDLIQRDAAVNDADAGNFHSVRRLIAACHEDPSSKEKLVSRAAELVRSLHRAGIVRLVRDTQSTFYWVVVNDDLQVDFSLFHNLSLFLVDAIERLNRESPDFALDLLSLVESVLEDPVIILRRQVDRAKTELLAKLKAEGVTYEERVARLDEVTHPQPISDFIWAAFDHFLGDHPWVNRHALNPKSVAREMVENYDTFAEYVRRYGLQRQEGVLLRYLSQVYKTLDQNVPDWAKDDAVWDVVGYLRALLERVDSSLLEEWEGLMHPELRFQGEDLRVSHLRLAAEELGQDERKLQARVRAELHLLLRALAHRDWEEAERAVRQIEVDGDPSWPAARFASALKPYYERYEELRFDHHARLADKTVLRNTGDLRWTATQVLCDPEGDESWFLETTVDLGDVSSLDGPIIALEEIGSY